MKIHLTFVIRRFLLFFSSLSFEAGSLQVVNVSLGPRACATTPGFRGFFFNEHRLSIQTSIPHTYMPTLSTLKIRLWELLFGAGFPLVARLAWNSQKYSCVSLSSVRIIGVSHCARTLLFCENLWLRGVQDIWDVTLLPLQIQRLVKESSCNNCNSIKVL